MSALEFPGDNETWTNFGFDCLDECTSAGAVSIYLDAAKLWWRFDESAESIPWDHPNTVTKIDHVVLFVKSLDEALQKFERSFGLQPSKRGKPREDGPEMAWIRAGEPLIEIAQQGDVDALWGITFRVADLQKCREVVGEARISESRSAVQGGFIATARGTPFPAAFRQK